MNQITLSFRVSSFEKDFRQQKLRFFEEIIAYQKWIHGIICFIQSLTSLIQKDWILASLCMGTLIFIVISIKFKQRYPLIYKFVIITFLLIYNIYKAVGQYLNLVDSNFAEGFFVAAASLTSLCLLNFVERTFLIVSMLTVHLVFGIPKAEATAELYIRYVLYGLIYLQFCYHFEKQIRGLFIEQWKQYQQLLKIMKFNNIQSFSMKYDERKSLVLIEKNNSKKIKKNDQEDFNKLVNYMSLSMKSYKSRVNEIISMENALSPQRQTLKQLLLTMTMEQSNYTAETPLKNDREIKLFGFYQQTVYSLCIFQCYDVEPVTILLLKENKSESQEEEIKLRIRNNQKQFHYLKQIFDQQIKKSLVSFRWIQNFANKQTQIKEINSVLRCIHYNLIKGYTDFLNLDIFCSLSALEIKLQNFNIEQLIRNSIQICDGYQKSQQSSISCIQFYEIKNNLSNSNIISDFKCMKLLILNLLFYIGQSSQSIIIFLDEVTSSLVQSPILKVKIIYQGPTKSKQQMKNLPIINPQSLQEQRHNSKVPLDLDLAISILLVRKLGPFDKIKVVQQKRRCNYLEFYLFKELTEEFLLIPVISLKPFEKITTQQQSILVNSFSTSINFDSVQESLHYL